MSAQSFVLKHTFEDVTQLTVKSSPHEYHFGFDWYIQIKKTAENFEAYLCRWTKEEEMPPVTISFSISMKSVDGKETVKKNVEYTFGHPYGWGWLLFEKWDKVVEKYISNDKLTIESHAEIVKVFTVSSIKREFTMVQTIENLSQLNEKWSPVETHFDIPWVFVVKRVQNSFKVDLYCKKKKQSNIWWIDVKLTFKVKATNGTIFQQIRALSFNEKKTCHGFTELTSWDNVVNKCMKDEKIEVEVYIQILNMIGIHPNESFGTEEDSFSDVCLKAGGKEFKVSKAILGRFSPVFRSMFSGDFVEAKSKEVVIEDVDADSFQTFLSLIYVYKPEINSGNVKSLLILADRYDVSRITRKCVKFMIRTDEMNVKEKLELADQFQLIDLQEHILDSLKTGREVKALKERMEKMSFAMTTAFLNRAMSLVS